MSLLFGFVFRLNSSKSFNQSLSLSILEKSDTTDMSVLLFIVTIHQTTS
ncbi:MAG: hypothetical protein U9Q66_01045 [Patescibacteria group bacterium]|nr:hypothetical protein [Patescibacteria group bacterium]